jgi:hypothetical protein
MQQAFFQAFQKQISDTQEEIYKQQDNLNILNSELQNLHNVLINLDKAIIMIKTNTTNEQDKNSTAGKRL